MLIISRYWIQRDEFNFWTIDVLTLIASVFLIVVKCMKTETKGRQTLLRFRVDYEALHYIHFFAP
ncbi:hypothetical protein C1645_833912 [Glomus cerebriforme]|uniref:Uncharacterized protein n=1 Tax=Glomus cerebriforme TaxID=658196 RepID=A0A397SD15_9GLOM|nr:hypothetical protein C1645_833912 [Glomus cerebriforme]